MIKHLIFNLLSFLSCIILEVIPGFMLLSVDITGIQNSISWLSLKCLNTALTPASLDRINIAVLARSRQYIRRNSAFSNNFSDIKIMSPKQMSWARPGLALLFVVLIFKSTSAASIPGDTCLLWCWTYFKSRFFSLRTHPEGPKLCPMFEAARC